MARRAEAKKGGSSRIFELLYFQNRKEFAADFFCVFILPIDEQRVWIWAKSEGVTCQLFWKVVHLAWNDPMGKMHPVVTPYKGNRIGLYSSQNWACFVSKFIWVFFPQIICIFKQICFCFLFCFVFSTFLQLRDLAWHFVGFSWVAKLATHHHLMHQLAGILFGEVSVEASTVFIAFFLSVRPLKLNNEFPAIRVCYVLKMAETLIIFIHMLIISI